jgi:deoxyribose-phosphate aldolase
MIDPEKAIQKAFEKESQSGPAKEQLRQLVSFLDLTTLEGTDNNQSIEALCAKALGLGARGLPLPAAVCVYTPFIRKCRMLLKGTDIRIATVSGYFPSGQAPLSLKVDEVKFAVEEGADEVDIVISRGRLMEGDAAFVRDEIAAIREVMGHAHLKVILETGELKTKELIKQASEISIRAGADFIKTSTGKITPAATEEAAVIMLGVIRDYFRKTGRKIGFKPAGGISDPLQAWRYMVLVKSIAGEEWLTPELFRIGASRLADNLVKEILT